MIFLTRNTSESGGLTCFVLQESGRKVPNLIRPELFASRRCYRFGGVVGFLVDVAVEVVEVGWTKPSVRVSRNATRSSSSREVRFRCPMVMFKLSESSGMGQQVTFSTVPAGQLPES